MCAKFQPKHDWFSIMPPRRICSGRAFWIRRAAALGGEDATIAHWQIKRDGTKRGILEIIDHD